MSDKELRIEQLLEKEIFKLPDDRELYEGACEELEWLLKGEKQI
ncbi:Fur-regulated basic protein FbpA [Bacillus toyonensis]|uniref:Fur-regulated basic protein FbpA n=1 Tax=Bacillus toyonensis TaxID=155322 RepID=A0A2A8H9L9_9BACI|nr:Fur-regulated basic protein FbpA [Bacillus toyonensis]